MRTNFLNGIYNFKIDLQNKGQFLVMNKFSKWVLDEGGQTVIAEKLGVTPQCVSVWVRGVGRPRAAMALRIVSLSRGKLTLEDVFKVGPKTLTTKK